jgi:hypothetical protein
MAAMMMLFASCSDIYDNIKEFSMKETVYPAHFDTIFARSGYERVEIDLVKEGRLPPQLMYLGKAKKTLVEYDGKTKEYDSVCSWVNITDLTLPKLYRFKIYTLDEYDNHSTPMEIALTPYTSVDKNALAVPSPNILTLAGFIAVEWTNGLSSDIMDYIKLSYSYTDKEGRIRTGETTNNQFFVNNIEVGEEVPVDVRFWVIPKMNGESILDSVSFDQQFQISMAAGATPIEFTVSPSRMALITGRYKQAIPSLQYGLSWTSSNPAVATVNVNGVIMARSPGTAIITVKSEAIENSEATVTVVVPDVSSYPAGNNLAGIWTFDDGNDLVKASVGADLTPDGDSFTPTEGPANTGGVRIGTGSFYHINHEMTASGGKNVNEYTIMMDIRAPASNYTAWKSVFNTRPDNISAGIFWIDGEGKIGQSQLGGYSTTALLPDTWHRVVIVAKLEENKQTDLCRMYIDSEYVWEATSNIDVDGLLSIDPEALYIGCDDMGRGTIGPDFAEIRIWNVRLTEAQIKALGKPED